MKSFYLTDPGMIRDHNEDSVIIVKNDENSYLMAIADGMGGHSAGEVASSIAISYLGKHFKETFINMSKVDAVKWIRDAVDEIDSFTDTVEEYDGTDLTELDAVLAPAPFVTDKIDDHLTRLWSEFFRLIGVANIQEQKRERVIRDEMLISQGGTIASRYSRFEPRKHAVELINEKFKQNIEVRYYDGEPDSKEKGDEDVSNVTDIPNVSDSSESVQIAK